MKTSNSLKPTIGLLVAPASGRMPPGIETLFDPPEVRFITEGVGIGEVSPDAFDLVEQRIFEKALVLQAAGAQRIILMGTSLTFYRGLAYTDRLRDQLSAITGVPCTTMSHAIVDSMRVLGMTRVAVATSYIDELNEALASYLQSCGFQVLHVSGLGIRGVDAMRAVPREALIKLSQQVIGHSERADGLLISCTGLNTVGLHAPLEDLLQVPVTSSAPAGLWHIMRHAGLPTDRAGFGRLFALGHY